MPDADSTPPSMPVRFRDAREAIVTLKKAGYNTDDLKTLIGQWFDFVSQWPKEKADVEKKLKDWGIADAPNLSVSWIEKEKKALKKELENLIETEPLPVADAAILIAKTPADYKAVESALKPKWVKRRKELLQRFNDLEIGTADERVTWANDVVVAEKEDERKKLKEAEEPLPGKLRDLKRELREHLVDLREGLQEYVAKVAHEGVPAAKANGKAVDKLIKFFDTQELPPAHAQWSCVDLTLVKQPGSSEWSAAPSFPGEVQALLHAASLPLPGFSLKAQGTHEAKPVLNRQALAAAALGAQYIRLDASLEKNLKQALKAWCEDSRLPFIEPELVANDHVKPGLLNLLQLNRAVMLYVWLLRRLLAEETATLAAQQKLLEIREEQANTDAPLPVKEVVKDFHDRLKTELDAFLTAWETKTRNQITDEKKVATQANEKVQNKARDNVTDENWDKRSLVLADHDPIRRELFWTYSGDGEDGKRQEDLVNEVLAGAANDASAQAPTSDFFAENMVAGLKGVVDEAYERFDLKQDKSKNANTGEAGGDTKKNNEGQSGEPSKLEDNTDSGTGVSKDKGQDNPNAHSLWDKFKEVGLALKRDLFDPQLSTSELKKTALRKHVWKTPYAPSDQGSMNLVWSLLKEAASMPMRIIAPVFGLFAFLMILGISNPIKQATKGFGEEVITPPYFFYMLLAFLLLLGAAVGLLTLVWKRQLKKNQSGDTAGDTPVAAVWAPLVCLFVSALVVSSLKLTEFYLGDGLWFILWLFVAGAVLCSWGLFSRPIHFGRRIMESVGVLFACYIIGVLGTAFVRNISVSQTHISDAADLATKLTNEADTDLAKFLIATKPILVAIQEKVELAQVAIKNVSDALGPTTNATAREVATAQTNVEKAKTDVEKAKTDVEKATDVAAAKAAVDTAKAAVAAAKEAVGTAKGALDTARKTGDVGFRTSALLLGAALLFTLALILHFNSRALGAARRALGAARPALGWPVTYFGSLVAIAGLVWLPHPVLDSNLEKMPHFQKAAEFTASFHGVIIMSLMFLAVFPYFILAVAFSSSQRTRKASFWCATILGLLGALLVLVGLLDWSVLNNVSVPQQLIVGYICLGVALVSGLGRFLNWSKEPNAAGDKPDLQLRWLKVVLLLGLGSVSWLWLQGLSIHELQASRDSAKQFWEYAVKAEEYKDENLNAAFQKLKNVCSKDWTPPTFWWSETSLGRMMVTRLVYKAPKTGKETTELPYYDTVSPKAALWVYGGLFVVLVWGGVVVQKRRIDLYKDQRKVNDRDAREKLIEEVDKRLQKDLATKHEALDTRFKEDIEDNRQHAEAWLELKVLSFDVAYTSHFEKARARMDGELAVIEERLSQVKTQEKLLKNLEKSVEKTESTALKLREIVRKDSLL